MNQGVSLGLFGVTAAAAMPARATDFILASFIQRRSKLALVSCVSATAAIETPARVNQSFHRHQGGIKVGWLPLSCSLRSCSGMRCLLFGCVVGTRHSSNKRSTAERMRLAAAA